MTTPETIIAAIYACETQAELDAVSDKYRARVKELADDPVTRARALHISNAKSQKLGWLKQSPG